MEGEIYQLFCHFSFALDRETPEFQLAMFKHAIGDDALKVIKTFNYAEGENSSDWRVVMGKMEKHCIGEVNEIYERYCFNMRDKLPTESVDSFVAELRNLAKTCNFCDCLRDSLRDLTLNRCIDVCRSEEVAELQMKSLSGPVDNINQVKSSSKKPRAPTPVDGRSAKKISYKFCGYDHQPDRKMCPAWGKNCK